MRIMSDIRNGYQCIVILHIIPRIAKPVYIYRVVLVYVLRAMWHDRSLNV